MREEVMVTKFWRKVLKDTLFSSELNIGPSALGALLFRSTKKSSELLQDWDAHTEKALTFLHKVSQEKQDELFRHVLVPFSFRTLEPRISYYDLFVFTDERVDETKYMMEYVPEATQVMPIYDVDEHIEIAFNFVETEVFNKLKTSYDSQVFEVEGNRYISLTLLLLLSETKAEFWKLLDNANINAPSVTDITEEAYSVRIVYGNDDYTTFLLSARRGVVKDFSLLPNCFCTKVSAGKEKSLNRRSPDVDEFSHIVTVLRPASILRSAKSTLLEDETIEILKKLK